MIDQAFVIVEQPPSFTHQPALHGRFGENNRYRGPIRFHMDLE